MDPNFQRLPSLRPLGVTVIAIVNGIGFLLTLVFWGIVAFKKLVPFPTEISIVSERANAATTWGFLIADIALSVPLLFLSALGLWRQRPWGWTAAQMVNVLWVYAMIIVLMRDAFTTMSPGGLLFTPFALLALWATYYLWKHRELFWT